MMEGSFTPVQSSKSRAQDELRFDHSILNTPKPQASSTVNRKTYEPHVPVKTQVQADPPVNSPSYLLNAIDGMKLLADQLGSLNQNPSVIMPPPAGLPIRKAVSVAELCENRRESAAAESEANSSLGILKLDEFEGFSEAENNANVSDFLAKFRKEFSFQSLQKENVQPNPILSRTNLNCSSTYELDTGKEDRRAGSDISSKVLNESSSSQSQSMQADLRLRLQKALAQRTIDRSTDSVRMSQLGDSFDVDGALIGDNVEAENENRSQDPIGVYFSSVHTPSPVSNVTFGAANFTNFSGSPVVLDSSENFQPADMAMDRLKQDENSWRQHFEDLPAVVTEPKSNAAELEHLTQNLDLSTMSGIIAGDITVSSSIMEDGGKRRLSAGEYFKLYTEHLGGVSDDQRPNFGNLIRSPPKRRPHPPLINFNNSQGSVDEVPTRDAGLDQTLASSLADTFNFSVSVSSDVLHHPSHLDSVENLASRSMDLMPPPPPRPKPVSFNAKNRSSEIRDSLSTRLSMSLSLPRESEESYMKDLNSSSLSLDSGEKLVSISQMVRILQEQPSGTKSARQLVDELMQKIKIPQMKTERESSKSQSAHLESSYTSNSGSNPHSLGKTLVVESSENSPLRNQRVKDWISAINSSQTDSVFDNDLQDSDKIHKPVDKVTFDSKRISSVSEASNPPYVSSPTRSDGEVKANQFKLTDLNNERGGSLRGDDSVSSFMPPPALAQNPVATQLRHFSTPKAYAKQFTSKVLNQRTSGSQIPNKLNLSSRRLIGSEKDLSGGVGGNSEGTDQDQPGAKFHSSHDQSSDSKQSSQNSLPTQKSYGRRSGPQKSDEPRPPSNCGSARSRISSTKSSSKHTDLASITSGPLQIDSTHTQLSWASVSPGSSVTQTFALRNKASMRVRLLVSSPNAAFKLVGERGEVLAELVLTLHSEETRRIHVVFSPISTGTVVGKLVISRVATSESSASSNEDRRLIGLYGYGGVAELAVDGASKDRWAQLFLNMCMVDCDAHSEVLDIDASHDAPQVVASFSVRNSGKVPAYISLQIAGVKPLTGMYFYTLITELPFMDCGVYVTPKEVSLLPGETSRITVRFDPGRDILQWLNKNADDMQLLANIWLSWSELATWQRIRRIFIKYYKSDKLGPLSTWGSLYSGDLGVGHELKDNKSSESVLAQAVRRLKVAVLIERERLNLFDMDATLVFDQLVANETAMFNSPQLNEKTSDSPECIDSPILAGMSNGFPLQPDVPSNAYCKGTSDYSPLLSITPFAKMSSKNQVDTNAQNELVVNTSTASQEPQTFSLEFPPTILKHKSKVRVTYQNLSSERNHVSISDLSPPFSVSTPAFYVPPSSYATMSIFFKPIQSGTHHSTINVKVNGNFTRRYLLRGEGVHE